METLFNRLAIAFLVMNICIVSIPRCDSVFASIKHHLLSDEHAGSLDCGNRANAEGADAALQEYKVCRCSILAFTFFTNPSINYEQFVLFTPQLIKLIIFLPPQRLLSYMGTPEPPYPKAP